jgi:hypothetical protein
MAPSKRLLGAEKLPRAATPSPLPRVRISKLLRSPGIDSKESICQPMKPEPVFVKTFKEARNRFPCRNDNTIFRTGPAAT